MTNLYTKYEKCRSLLSWDIVFTNHFLLFRNFTASDLKWPLTSTRNNRVLPLNMTNLYAKYDKCQSLLPWHIVFISHFWCFRNFIAGDLKWPLTSTKNDRIIYSIWPTHTTNMRILTFTLLEISCLHGFDLLTSLDPKWPLTSTKNDRDHLRNMANLHT